MAGLFRFLVAIVVTRVAVFIDYQNVYQGARAAFGLQSASFVEGQVRPQRLGLHLTHLGTRMDADRELWAVRVYRGEPSPKHSPAGQAACQRQVAAWSALGLVTPVVRPLRYYPDGTVREKGIDVLIALDIAEGAANDEYDVAVLVSADSDLTPALERAMRHGKRVEVAGWRSPSFEPRLRVPGRAIWCHWLDESSYRQLHDPTDYTRSGSVGVAH